MALPGKHRWVRRIEAKRSFQTESRQGIEVRQIRVSGQAKPRPREPRRARSSSVCLHGQVARYRYPTWPFLVLRDSSLAALQTLLWPYPIERSGSGGKIKPRLELYEVCSTTARTRRGGFEERPILVRHSWRVRSGSRWPRWPSWVRGSGRRERRAITTRRRAERATDPPRRLLQGLQFLAVASAGKTLCLLDGTYAPGRDMILPPQGLHGAFRARRSRFMR